MTVKKLVSAFLIVLTIFLGQSIPSTFALTGNSKVSVIIPVYNTEKYLPECLDSIVCQTLSDIEIICINDGSTDGSLNILCEYAKKDNRIKIIDQENKGVCSARNRGIKASTGEYIAFVDSDDSIDANAYEVAYNLAIKTSSDIVMFGEDRFSTATGNYDDPFKAMDTSGALMIWNKLYKRSLLIENHLKFYKKARCYNDECFNFAVIPKAKHIERMANKFYHYRRNREGSIQTSAKRNLKIKNCIIFADYACKSWAENGYLKNHGQRILKKVSSSILRSIYALETQEEKTFYANQLFEIITSYKIYTPENIEKLDKFSKSQLKRWMKNVTCN